LKSYYEGNGEGRRRRRRKVISQKVETDRKRSDVNVFLYD
jgi:hypothetical protein